METELRLIGDQSQENAGTSDDHVTSIMEADRQWLKSVEKKTKLLPKLLNNSAGKSSCCIFRVPHSLVEINKKAYHPHIVSIGPYHHGKVHLKMIEEHKWRFLGGVLARTQQHGIGINDFFKAIAPIEEKIRDCYSETIECSRQEFLEMMVLDGCFIIELFCIVGGIVQGDIDDPIFKMTRMIFFIMRDLLKLENQIPFFVLETLFETSILSSRKQNVSSLTVLALKFFDHAVQRPPEVLRRYKDIRGGHLLDLFRSTIIPSSQEVHRKISPFLQLIQPANKLHQAGIKFKPRETDSFLDIEFSNGVLEIPLLTVDDFTTSVILNCVAFEQCYAHCSNHITSYVTFMGCLINAPSDAGFLCEYKIVENYFGADEEIASFFNNVGKDVTFDIQRSYLSKVFEDVNEHYSNNWHVRWAEFKHAYFDTPWSFISALAAFVLLVLTMIQAFFAFYGYFRPPKQ
ncbi:hypothetical protein NC653_011915 [Populus alba x Populus x berolinensis]|uniref:Uncharacterized protein n=2 Tax=Populus alba x Populus x berolinensis TaxID=444605 RepID=A0AAD6R3C0_9ROSI|nr:hypothetical protein NC653_011915 [Populus alba x Populus x berolinensis]